MSAMGVRQEDEQEVSCFATSDYPWQTTHSYLEEGLEYTRQQFDEVCNFLLCNPQLNSTHLFRADILYDSAHLLKSPAEKELLVSASTLGNPETLDHHPVPATKPWLLPFSSECISSLRLQRTRTLVRRLIPRKPKVDRLLEQTCFMYCEAGETENVRQSVVVYRPHVASSSEMPWYHPRVQALAFYYAMKESQGSLSVHFLPFSADDAGLMSDRLHRTMLSLLKTLLRLMRHNESKGKAKLLAHNKTSASLPISEVTQDTSTVSLSPASLKDTIIPQHQVQDTYTRLKETYASDLMSRWVETTEASKHVFEDLSIAAFLIELWKQMYSKTTTHPGFVDVACGNGVLVYILLKEGYPGYGFDARRRKTWDILGLGDRLTEQICIPQPFLDTLNCTPDSILPGITVHNGIFPSSTFIISNHADELTPWTPLLACQSSPTAPNPFLAIPCCSHALSGARHRYQLSEIAPTITEEPDTTQPRTGDLQALRTARESDFGHEKSMYGCLTRKVAALAREVGCSVELTLMRIPSTRNIGIVGNGSSNGVHEASRIPVGDVVDRECRFLGGVHSAARSWVDRASRLHSDKGRGKVNEKWHKRGAT